MTFSIKTLLIAAFSVFFCAHVFAAETQSPSSAIDHLYLGVFGGGGNTMDGNLRQQGIAFFSEANGGPLQVNATGRGKTNLTGIAGMQFGYTGHDHLIGGKNSLWSIVPSSELEGFYLGSTQTGTLENPTTRIDEHIFNNSFPMHTGVYLANAVLTFNTPHVNRIHPYIAGGIGAARLSIAGANSLQTESAEPNINHFNSNPSATDWAFAAQSKMGLKMDLNDHWDMFAEYRLLYLAPTTYTFGSTQYGTHVPTTNWSVNFPNMLVNVGAIGVRYKF